MALVPKVISDNAAPTLLLVLGITVLSLFLNTCQSKTE